MTNVTEKLMDNDSDWVLWGIGGAYTGAETSLSFSDCVIGSGNDCDLIIDDGSVNGFHAALEVSKDNVVYYLLDLDRNKRDEFVSVPPYQYFEIGSAVFAYGSSSVIWKLKKDVINLDTLIDENKKRILEKVKKAEEEKARESEESNNKESNENNQSDNSNNDLTDKADKKSASDKKTSESKRRSPDVDEKDSDEEKEPTIIADFLESKYLKRIFGTLPKVVRKTLLFLFAFICEWICDTFFSISHIVMQ
jgi:hypothetical protein